MVQYQPMLNNYACHRMLLFLPGKHECKKLRIKYFFADNNYVITERFYDEALKE